MNVEFLGTAGYHPNESRHTSSIYVAEASDDCAFALDAGTGLFRLAGRKLPAQLRIFLTHAHLDHVAGLTFLLDILLGQTCEVTVYGSEITIDTVTRALFDSPLFPLPFQHKVQIVSQHDDFEVCGVRVRTFPLTHPGGSLAYRFDWPDRSLAYVTDTVGNENYIDFVRGANLLIHERNFADDLIDIAEASGHCTSTDVSRIVSTSGVGRLVLTHFNPLTTRNPADEDSLGAKFPEIVFAYDNLKLDF